MAKTNDTTKTPAVAKTVLRGPFTDATGYEVPEGSAYGVRFAFSNGKGFDALFDAFEGYDALSQMGALTREALAHGLAQKIGDAAAISRNTDNGASASVDDKYNAAKAVFDRLMAGQWNAPREGGGNEGGVLLRALVRYYEGKRTPEQVKEWLDGRTDAEKAALRKNAKVAAIIVAIQAEKVDPSIDTDSLLDTI